MDTVPAGFDICQIPCDRCPHALPLVYVCKIAARTASAARSASRNTLGERRGRALDLPGQADLWRHSAAPYAAGKTIMLIDPRPTNRID
jgi:hypothetical protein